MAEPAHTTQQPVMSFTKKVWIIAGIALLTVSVFLLFKTLFSLLLLMLAGILLAVFFHGCADIIQRNLHFSSKVSLILSILLNVVLLIGFFWFIGARLSSQLSELSDTLPKTIQDAKNNLQQSEIGKKVINYVNSSGNSKKTISTIRHFFSSGFGVLSDLYIIVLIGLFFTASPALYKKGMVHLLPPAAKEKGDKLIGEINVILKKWIKGQIFGFLFIAVFTGIGLWILGMPLVLTLALIAGILNMIPNFGPIIALIPAVLIAFTLGTTTVIIVICIYTGVQIIQSAVTQPLIQQKMISVPPALIIIGQVAMGTLGGFWGVLLAMPVVAILMKLINELYVKPQSHHKYKLKPMVD
jgi:predicted PurR-regulated permease PerM